MPTKRVLRGPVRVVIVYDMLAGTSIKDAIREAVTIAHEKDVNHGIQFSHNGVVVTVDKKSTYRKTLKEYWDERRRMKY